MSERIKQHLMEMEPRGLLKVSVEIKVQEGEFAEEFYDGNNGRWKKEAPANRHTPGFTSYLYIPN